MNILPISKYEFLKLIQSCKPPSSWTRTIAVGNSGGPDSTCLLFLLHQCVKDNAGTCDNFPREVVSLTVDHGLQPSSAEMANHSARTAQALGVRHSTITLPWSVPPFPPKPFPGESIENVARLSRFKLLFNAMTSNSAQILALGHHADDQVETSLARLAKGTTEIGAGGMRKYRRWGMGTGNESSLGWAGYEGLNRWMIRPLLSVSKDRILATCEANNLDYITDQTNFQPHLTLRNTIRYLLNNPSIDVETLAQSVPAHIADDLRALDKAVQELEAVRMDLSHGAQQLRGAVNVLGRRVEDMDRQVDTYLKRAGLPSPPGTYMLSSRALSAIRDQTIRHLMILRVLRYVSFHPWGSLRADGNRRKTSIQQIAEKVWHPEPFKVPMFVGGGGVLWTPVLTSNDKVKFLTNKIHQSPLEPGDTYAWVASRQPPSRPEKHLVLDITQQLASAKAAGDLDTLEILYDCRFLVTFYIHKMPDDITRNAVGDRRIVIDYHTRWYLPRVILRREDDIACLTTKIEDDRRSQMQRWPQSRCAKASRGGAQCDISCDWISIRWIRPLDAS